jgi:hypothetical protein
VTTDQCNSTLQRGADLILVRFDPSVHPVSVQISGRDVAFGKKSTDLSMFLYGMGSRGTDLELTLKLLLASHSGSPITRSARRQPSGDRRTDGRSIQRSNVGMSKNTRLECRHKH